ncbi:MAG TPA: NADH-quinone oxidoreductase subunit D [Candidatus Dormibacteraeota bacterium]|nr:NADH-quinone oxidoreductase subunit D [Candidatus Dormibacteraeota bacterium]
MTTTEKPPGTAELQSMSPTEPGAQTMTLSVGPQHSGSGHMRLIVELDGDIIISAMPDPGYVHRGIEKIIELRNIIRSIPVIERPSIIDASNLNHAWVKAIEELQGVEAPSRGQYLRCLLNEMNRIMSHLYWLSIYGVFLGHTTMFMWPLGDRELFIDLAERLTGARITYSYLVPGGVRRDLPQGFTEEAIKRTKYFEKRLDEYENIFFKNPLFTSRSKGVGILSRERAVSLGSTGPTLRGSGIDRDLRKDEPYAAYGELDFKVSTRPDGDSYSRAMVHMDEMRESCQLIRQILEKIPSGPVRRKAPIVVPRGEAYARVESARGECSFYMIGEGGDKPYRARYITGSYRNMAAIPEVLKGVRLADMPTSWWSIDYWPVEADR